MKVKFAQWEIIGNKNIEQVKLFVQSLGINFYSVTGNQGILEWNRKQS